MPICWRLVQWVEAFTLFKAQQLNYHLNQKVKQSKMQQRGPMFVKYIIESHCQMLPDFIPLASKAKHLQHLLASRLA